tara:strand:+ start:23 stop:157 length:135 start_codon:yes stop_codon:yes gene_type:complete
MHYVRNSAGAVMAIKLANKSAKIKKESSAIKNKEVKKSADKSKI